MTTYPYVRAFINTWNIENMDLRPYLQNASFDYTEYVYLSMQVAGWFGLCIDTIYRCLLFIIKLDTVQFDQYGIFMNNTELG